MKTDNKENTVPNQNKVMFSNPIICAKMFNSNHNNKQCEDKKQTTHAKTQCKINQKIKSTLDCLERTVTQELLGLDTPNLGSSHEISMFNSYKKLTCEKHLKPLSNLFCNNCLCYNICRTCVSDAHSQHQVMQFSSEKELVNQTKQILLQNLQQTLKQLKSKQNEVKNRAHEVNLVRNSLRSLQQDIISIISGFFRDIQGKLLNSIQKNQEEFNKQVQDFFSQFNKTNDDLRQSLMKILDGQIDIKQFDKKMIIKDAPPTPNFINYKTTLQKYKKIFKNIKGQLTKIKSTIEQGINSIEVPDNHHQFKNVTNATLTKFDKYIENNNHKADKVNQHFLKTLRLLGMPNQKQNLSNYNAVRGQAKSVNRKIF